MRMCVTCPVLAPKVSLGKNRERNPKPLLSNPRPQPREQSSLWLHGSHTFFCFLEAHASGWLLALFRAFVQGLVLPPGRCPGRPVLPVKGGPWGLWLHPWGLHLAVPAGPTRWRCLMPLSGCGGVRRAWGRARPQCSNGDRAPPPRGCETPCHWVPGTHGVVLCTYAKGNVILTRRPLPSGARTGACVCMGVHTCACVSTCLCVCVRVCTRVPVCGGGRLGGQAGSCSVRGTQRYQERPWPGPPTSPSLG